MGCNGSTLYTSTKFYSVYMPSIVRVMNVLTNWKYEGYFRNTVSARFICRLYESALIHAEQEYDIENTLKDSLTAWEGQNGEFEQPTQEWQQWVDSMHGDYVLYTSNGDLVRYKPFKYYIDIYIHR